MTARPRISFLFYIKRTKLLRNGEAPIYLKIKVDKESSELAILKSIMPQQWDIAKNGAKGSSREAQDVNNYIGYIRQQLSNRLNHMYEKGVEITAIGLKNAFLGKNDMGKSLVNVVKEHNDTVKKLIGKEYSPATYKKYETTLMHLQAFINTDYSVADLSLGKIDPDFIRGFEVFLKAERNCQQNSTMKHIKNLKKVIRICVGNGWMKTDPFINYKIRIQKVEKDFLTEEELQAITCKDFRIGRLQQVADTFLFACYTGYAYSDLKTLSPENLFESESGQLWIHTKRHKTGIVSHVPLLPPARKILDKYRDNPYCIKYNVLLPVLSNQKLNSYLKEVADLCGITKNITSHVARHTFATTITLNNGIPIESVSKMLGHSSISMTQIYAKVLDRKVGMDMSKLRDKFSPESKKSILL
ncbi:MAG: recombinase [Bacteroidetes bacterium HGW-Bacteroidetes-6]|jgi:site-specific recombinase XerD|nr:MAG: recombinase [Bacteroidetes bacterium HGW-Bacteroidetes-6]